MGPFEPTKDSDGRWRSQAGATAVEYAIMVSLIAVVIIGSVLLLGQATRGQFDCTTESYAQHEDRCKEADGNNDD